MKRFDKKTGGVQNGGNVGEDDFDTVAQADVEMQENRQKVGNLPPRTPVDQKHRNYGKVPKYLEKYKNEADELAKKREELKAAKAIPAGMKQIDEAERVQTLE